MTTKGAYCQAHTKAKQQQADAYRGSSTERGYGYKWQKESKAYLRDHPLCECEACLAGEKLLKVASIVDHKIPHRLKQAKDSGNPELIAKAEKLFWSRSNWQAMAKECHDRKTAREDGGFRGATQGGGQKSGAFSL